jgi:hypothetical protein
VSISDVLSFFNTDKFLPQQGNDSAPNCRYISIAI